MTQLQKNKIGATPGKLALVGGLAVVLVLVIVKQMPSDGAALNLSAVHEEVASQDTSVEISAAKTISVKPDAKTRTEAREWPTQELAVTLANNPFALPAWKDRPEALTNKNTPGLLATLQEQGASIVMIGDSEKYATIGDQRVQVGDIVDGYQVTDITDEGIVLDKL